MAEKNKEKLKEKSSIYVQTVKQDMDHYNQTIIEVNDEDSEKAFNTYKKVKEDLKRNGKS